VREELFITSKLWNTYHEPCHVRQACQRTLKDLGLRYLDLYLIHFPIALKFVPFETRYPPEWLHDPKGPNPHMEYANVPLHLTWAAMEELVDAELVKNIGMCNVGTCVLRDMLTYARYGPQVLQVELHPQNSQEHLIRFCKEQGICVTGFSPLASANYLETSTDDSVLQNRKIIEIANSYGKSAAQVVLRWAVQRGTAIVPKSMKIQRMRENVNIFDFELTEQEMSTISSMDRGCRYNDPATFTQGMNSYCPIYH